MNKIFKIICLVLIISFVFILKANSYKVRFAQEYKSYDELNNAYKEALEKKDTLIALSRLIELSDHDRDKGDYDLAFEKLWEAKFTAEKQKQEKTLIVINRDLGLLYDLYGKDSIALDYLYSSIILAKKIMDEDRSVREQLLSNYYCVSNFWRDRGKYNMSMTYLDSCVSLSSEKKPIPFVWSDMGFCYLKMNDISKAKRYLFKAKKILEEKKISYLATTLSYIGDYYIYVQNNDSALHYYKNSLNIIENYKVYTAIKPSLLEKISKIYIKKNNFREAVFYLKSSKNSYEDLFSISGKQNKRLFEIKNNYKQKIDLQKRELKNRETIINHKNSILLRLVMIIFILIIGLIFVYVFIQQRNKIKRLALAQEFNREKNKEILNVKNKELASYSLKMIELNDIISFLLKEIKKIDSKVFGNMSQRFGKSNGKSWEEFDKRFIEVNGSFYSELCRRHPDLSSSELRHCTLIKLNLDNTEIAKLLNISQQSLHTARYRIRKKLELRSSSDLTRYINNIK